MPRKKKKISPNELMFNFADWTELQPESTEFSEPSEFSEFSEFSESSEFSEPSEFSESSEPSEPSSPDLQYLEDTMFWALQQIDGIDNMNKTRLIAIESASVVLAGVTMHNIYQLQSYPYGRVDGYQLVALYYASFATAFPHMLGSISLPYAPLFEKAQQRFREFTASHP